MSDPENAQQKNFERLATLLMGIPDVNQEWLEEELNKAGLKSIRQRVEEKHKEACSKLQIMPILGIMLLACMMLLLGCAAWNLYAGHINRALLEVNIFVSTTALIMFANRSDS